jgi:hypothetical protein
MLAQNEVTELPPDDAVSAHPEDEALALLISRAIARGDHKMARDLAAVPARSEGAACVLVEADCPALARIAAVCDPIETLAWRRAIVHAGVRSDSRRLRALLELAARRCAA